MASRGALLTAVAACSLALSGCGECEPGPLLKTGTGFDAFKQLLTDARPSANVRLPIAAGTCAPSETSFVSGTFTRPDGSVDDGARATVSVESPTGRARLELTFAIAGAGKYRFTGSGSSRAIDATITVVHDAPAGRVRKIEGVICERLKEISDTDLLCIGTGVAGEDADPAADFRAIWLHDLAVARDFGPGSSAVAGHGGILLRHPGGELAWIARDTSGTFIEEAVEGSIGGTWVSAAVTEEGGGWIATSTEVGRVVPDGGALRLTRIARRDAGAGGNASHRDIVVASPFSAWLFKSSGSVGHRCEFRPNDDGAIEEAGCQEVDGWVVAADGETVWIQPGDLTTGGELQRHVLTRDGLTQTHGVAIPSDVMLAFADAPPSARPLGRVLGYERVIATRLDGDHVHLDALPFAGGPRAVPFELNERWTASTVTGQNGSAAPVIYLTDRHL